MLIHTGKAMFLWSLTVLIVSALVFNRPVWATFRTNRVDDD